jgi:hypothetical protein
MLIGQYIMRLSGGQQFSPPFARGGQGANYSINSLDVPANGAQLNVDVEHKNASDTSWTVLTSFTGITSTGLKSIAVNGGQKEMLRLVYSITGGSGPLPSDTFYVDVLPPVWIP